MTNSGSGDEDEQRTDDHDRMDDAPHGRFRVSLCSCCDVLTQATFWMALCCFPVLLAQVLTRLRLQWNGKEIHIEKKANHKRRLALDREEENAMTFNKIVLTFVGVLALGHIPVAGSLMVCLFYVGSMVWIGGNVRKYVRKRYRIPRTLSMLPYEIEDRCTMCCCACCALIQVARHTHDDKEYPGYCCTTTGLELGAPRLLATNINSKRVQRREEKEY